MGKTEECPGEEQHFNVLADANHPVTIRMAIVAGGKLQIRVSSKVVNDPPEPTAPINYLIARSRPRAKEPGTTVQYWSGSGWTENLSYAAHYPTSRAARQARENVVGTAGLGDWHVFVWTEDYWTRKGNEDGNH